MATTVNSNVSAALSPRASSGEPVAGPHAPPRRTTTPPWTQIVGGVTDPPAPRETLLPVAEFSYHQNTNQGFPGDSDAFENVNGSPKQAWNRSCNAALDTGLVMGAVAWPSLTESATTVPVKPPLPDSLTNPLDSPIPVPQVTAAKESSTPASPHKETASKPNKSIPNATQNYGRPARQKSIKREGSGSSSSDGGFSQSSYMNDLSHPNNSLPKTISSSGGSDGSVRDHGHNNAIREGAPRSGGDRPQQRNYRRSNSGSYLRGEGSFNSRRDHDRRGHDWNHQRSFNGRDQVMQPQRAGPSGFMRPPPPGAATYFPPPPIPYPGLMGIPSDVQPYYYYGPHPGMPVVAQMPPALYYPQPDPQLQAKIINQIDYYFSNENLIKDTYLRKNMDEYGWVSIQLIANFKKVVGLTTDIQLILDALRASIVVEVQGDKVRKRDDWMRWVMPSAQHPTASSSYYPQMLPDILPARVQGLTLEDIQN